MTRIRSLSSVACLLLSASVAASVVPDGSTATSVSLDSASRIVVDIAPADADRISHNRFQSFNVPANGIHINNRTAGARTIINEVTSLESSRLEGELRVLGTRAHLIIANPNGISINGAEFFNVASMALTTGNIGYQNRIDEFGDTYRNPTISVSQGEIVIGSEGLSGVINQLEILSKSLTIDGGIHNENESAFASVSVRTGESITEVNSRASVADPANAWVSSSATIAENNGIAVDISSRAGISGSRVAMMVTDSGAGVRIAGDILATANSFSISSTGLLSISGDIRAAGDVQIETAIVETRSEEGKQNTIESQFGAVAIDASDSISINGTLISANQHESEPALSLRADNDITLISRSDIERAVLFSGQSIGLESTLLRNQSGKILANTGISIDVDSYLNRINVPDFDGRGIIQSERTRGDRLWYTAFLAKEKIHTYEIDFGEPDAGRVLSEMLAGSGDIVINARVYDGYGANVIANDGSILINTEEFVNEAALVGRAWLTSTCSLGGCDERGGSDIELLGGSIQASNTLTINSPLSLINQGGTLQAVNDVTLNSGNASTRGTEVYNVYSRTKGLRGLFMRHDALWIATDQGGALISNMGKIIIAGSELINDGGRMEAADGVEGNYNVVREPTTQDLLMRRHIGILDGIF